MKICNIALLIILLIFANQVVSKAQTKTIFLVRHAEKAEDTAGDRDPVLTEVGIERANRLAYVLKDAEIEHIYSTDFKRNMQTALPIAEALGKEIIIYDSRDPEVHDKILSETGKDPVLIIGHANRIPDMLKALVGEEVYSSIEKSEYDNLFVITLSEASKDCVILKY